MVKEKRILSYILGWLIVGFIIIFMGVNNVFAASYDANNFTAQIYDNINGSLKSKTTTKETTGIPYYYSYDVGYTANSSGGAWGISSPIPLIANHTYSMTVDPIVVGCGFTILSSINRLGVGTSLGNAVTSYQNNTNVNEKLSQAVSNSRYLQYVFTPTINASYIVFPYSTTSSCDGRESQLTSIVIEDLGETGVSQDQINTSLNNQTNELNNSIQNSTDTIINNQNQNNEELKDTINENFNTCRPSVNLFNFNNYREPQADASLQIIDNNKGIVKIITESKYRFVYVFISGLEKNTNYTFSGKFTNSNPDMKDLWFSISNNPTTTTLYNNSYSSGSSVTFNTGNDTAFIIYLYGSGANAGPNEATWYDIQLEKGNKSTKFEPYGQEICSNKIDETNDKLDGIQGALTDSSSPNTSSLENSAGWLPPGPLDSILNLPLTMLNSLTNSLGKTCSPLNLTLPYVNKNIQIPCLSEIFAKITGVNGLWNWVGTIASVLILYNYLLNLYAWVDRILTLRAEFDEAMGADMANWGRL